ncbi:putative bifunctional diguanylate cyclase/phosphodiesterase [Pseudomarimonas arenosa]|uniref:EAL domain-containing protein n=1 Tax=Pseudomarimonas arenosa TaxID=2774145 RepID=A0AAW3ZJW5_9GAMM|nr:bifunctional diguanylate cyclase/phosphodiesterase [Pseudomarimonas arenosa]MBD8526058.1 EAL domain-containing protein [Pseudomarimonas arenosa]
MSQPDIPRSAERTDRCSGPPDSARAELALCLQTVLQVEQVALWEWLADGDRIRLHAAIASADTATEDRAMSELIDDSHVEDQYGLRESWGRLVEGRSDSIDCTFRLAHGMRWRWLRLRGRVTERGRDGRACRVLGTHSDVSRQHRQAFHQQLRAQCFSHSSQARWIVDQNGMVVDSNATAQSMTGCSAEELAGRSIAGVLPDVAHQLLRAQPQEWQGETQMKAAGGHKLTVEARLVPCQGRREGVVFHAISVRDITSQKLSARALDKLAHSDGLTSLPNRIALQAELRRRLAHNDPPELAVMFINLDGFKATNEALGHDFGDALLVRVAERLRELVPGSHVVGRWGADEFVLLIEHREPRAEAARMAERVLQALKVETLVEHHTMTLGASIGIAVAGEDGLSAELLIRRADAAMNAAKRNKRGGWEFFRDQFDEDSLRRLTLVNLLRQDADRGRFEFAAQPKVDPSGQPTGFELLIRWHTEAFGAVSPAYFIPLAEEIGVISALGREAMLAATHLIRGLHNAGNPLPVAVNLSSRQLIDPILEQALIESCAIEGIDPSWLEIEVTESALLDNVERAKTLLGALRQRGFRTALDDFGTGFSSLSYLRDLPFDKVKIDKSFVSGVGESPRGVALTRGIADLCRALGMRTVAEGVEQQIQWELLREIGVDEYQGFLFSPPLSMDEAIRYACRDDRKPKTAP